MESCTCIVLTMKLQDAYDKTLIDNALKILYFVAQNFYKCQKNLWLVSSITYFLAALWEKWSPWSACSISCGEGVAMRARECVKSSDQQDCEGSFLETKPCKNKACIGTYCKRLKHSVLRWPFFSIKMCILLPGLTITV